MHEIELTNPLCGFSILGSIEALPWHPVRVSDYGKARREFKEA